MKVIFLSIVLIANAASAYSLTATLVRQYTATSVTGQAINVCVYSAAGQQFERVLPFGTLCPFTIQVR